MKKVENNSNLEEWSLVSIDALKDVVLKAAGEAVDIAMEDDETYIYFPIEWDDGPGAESSARSDGLGGNAVTDPLTVYLTVALDSEGSAPTYSFNLRDCLTNSIKACAEDGSFSYGLGVLSAALRDLADEIDSARGSVTPK